MTWLNQRRLGVIASVAVIAMAVLTAAASTQARATVAAATRSLSPMAVLATAPGQVASLLLCSAALRVLDPGPGFLSCAISRWLRDAGGNLLALAPGLGELAGARALALAGSGAAMSLAATAVDVFCETIAQIPFVIFGFVLLGARTRLSWPGKPALAVLFGGSALVAAILAAGILARPWIRGFFRSARVASLRTTIRDKSRASPAAIGFHAAAWACGGVQVWCACAMLGWRLSLPDALALESLVYAARACAVVMPAGLGVQEAAFVFAGRIFGLAPEQGLALSMILRARDLLFGAPVLMLWPWLEVRAAQTA